VYVRECHVTLIGAFQPTTGVEQQRNTETGFKELANGSRLAYEKENIQK
jgi:hypothetical protein